MSNNLDNKIHKIYALYKRGVDGEKRNAEALLKNLLKKSNLTLKDYEARYHFNEAKYHPKKNNFCFYLLCLICKITYHFFITICETIYHFFIMMCEIIHHFFKTICETIYHLYLICKIIYHFFKIICKIIYHFTLSRYYTYKWKIYKKKYNL